MSDYKIIITDDHKLLSDGIEMIIIQSNIAKVIAKAIDGKDLLQLLNATEADLIILDVNMPRLDGFLTAELLKTKYPVLKILVISQHESVEMVKQFYNIGVDGYLPKSFEREELILAITKIKNGEKVFPLLNSNIEKQQNNSNAPYAALKNEFNLTDREIEIIILISKNITTKKIAEKLFLSEYTVETHRKNIGRKTNTNSPGSIMRFAIEHKLGEK